jgi:hypothetical protein
MTVTRRRIVILVLAVLFVAGAVFLGTATTPNEAEAAKAGGVV